MADLTDLQLTLGVYFKDRTLLEQALIHSSYVNENPSLAPVANERLEFLGDAVLGLIVARKLYQDYADLTEGEMTRLRSALVRRDTLTRMARSIRLGEYLYLGRGEDASGGRNKPANLSAALEAVIAAVFLDRGPDAASDFTLRLLDTELERVISQGAIADFKSQLQELVQAREQQVPTYHVIEEAGPAHAKTFTVEVSLGDIVLGRGTGKNKKAAETEAARSAMKNLSTSFTQ